MQIPPGNSTKPLGVQVLESRGQFADAYWYWIGIGALVGYIIIFNIGFTLAIAFMPGELIHTPLPHDDPNGSRSFTTPRAPLLFICIRYQIYKVYPINIPFSYPFKCFYFVT
jgi:hypothetical protein